ncbi:MAG: Rieske 2Fe-2S domain-containing protein [Ilumatobacter sp.]|nr:Rieske 2Fe-2S domain-containing protein [Ilumatobacter sp.]
MVIPLGLSIESLRRSSGTFETAVGLPPVVYSDAQFHDFEMNAVFGSGWLCVGRQEQVPAVGDYLSVTRAGEPLIVVRSSDGNIRVMSAVCQHRAMCITASVDRSDEDMLSPPELQSGAGRTFRCPYHYWVYDLDGQLVGAPEMGRTPGFDMAEVRLPGLPVEIWNGFIFTNFDAAAAPLAPQLSKLDEVLVNYCVESLVTVDPVTIPDVPFNWKIMVENFMEMYHQSRLHHGIHDFAPSSGASYADYEPGDVAMFGFSETLEPDGGFNPTMKALFPPLPRVTMEERQRVIFALVAPSLLMGFQADSAFWFYVDPTGPTSHALSMAYIFPESTIELPDFTESLEAAIAGVSTFNRQDMPTNVATQLGMQSRFAQRGRYSWQEGVLAQFNSWLVDRYAVAAGE